MHIPFLDQWGVILIVGLLLFGKRLPEVGRSIGKGIVEFKKGLQGIEEEVSQAGNTQTAAAARPAIADQAFKFDPNTGQPLHSQVANVPAGAKFDPYTGKPIEQSNA